MNLADVAEFAVASAGEIARLADPSPDARGSFTFRCPTCAKLFAYDSPLEPLCTGPNEGLDEHEPAVMFRIRA